MHVLHQSRTTIIFFLLFSVICFEFAFASSADTSSGTTSNSKYHVIVGLGGGVFRMDDINSYYIDGFARNIGLLDKHVHLGLDFFLGFDREISSEYSLGLGISFLHARTASVPTSDWPWPHRHSSLTSILIAPELSIARYITFNRISLSIAGGISVFYGEVILRASDAPDLPDQDYFSKAYGLGFFISTGLILRLTSSFSLGPELGYRRYQTGELKNDSEVVGAINNTDGDQNLQLDFSGPYLRIRMFLHFTQ